jgi:hypothetical protein
MSAANTLGTDRVDGTNWSAFVDSGTQIFSDLSCALLRKGAVFCVSRNLAGALTGSLFNTTTLKWGKFFNASGGTITSGPGCADDNDRDVICVMNGLVSGVNTVVANRFDGSKWEGFLNINTHYSASANPSCASLGLKGEVMFPPRIHYCLLGESVQGRPVAECQLDWLAQYHRQRERSQNQLRATVRNFGITGVRDSFHS